MYTYCKKKIITLTNRLLVFVRKNLVQITIIGGVFIFLQLIKSFPYINIIPSYQFLVIGFTLFLSVILFGVIIANRNIIIGVIILFAIAAITTILELEAISELLGFIIFMLLLITLRQVIIERKAFKQETNE